MRDYQKQEEFRLTAAFIIPRMRLGQPYYIRLSLHWREARMGAALLSGLAGLRWCG